MESGVLDERVDRLNHFGFALKLGAENRAHAAAVALRGGLLSSADA